MAKKTSKKSPARRKSTKKVAKKAPSRAGGGGRRGSGLGYKAGAAEGKQLVIVESPAKAKTINRYLGDGFVVLASVGHVRDLPSKAPKGTKQPVPGVDLENRFAPTYEILPGKDAVIRDLKRAAKDALGSGGEIWFATDLDREGEAIAWHLAQELGIRSDRAKRVVFGAITKDEIGRAFQHPHPIDEDRVNAQQARRILDRIVGYQVSPLLWKKVARGLSAGRVQSVAVRLVVERERAIDAHVPDESWTMQANFALDQSVAAKLVDQWRGFVTAKDAKGNTPTIKSQNAWLAEHRGVRAELIEVAGGKFDISQAGERGDDAGADLSPRVAEVARLAGLDDLSIETGEDADAKGPARRKVTISGTPDASVEYRVRSIETKRTKVKPSAPFITSTLQQAASSRLGFGAQRTMRAAQSLYEGVDIPGEGPVGLITYMRTDSTHLSGEAVSMARRYIQESFGDRYLPAKPQVYSSSNKAAQEAHEAIRPTSLDYPPDRVKRSLTNDQYRLYEIIWERFVSCQMSPAEWDSTSVVLEGGRDAARPVAFRASGRVLAFDGFYRVSGVPTSSETATLPPLEEKQSLHPFSIEPTQRFSSPPPRYTEASLIKKLEEEGIGRPSTYAAIIQTIQDRSYVEQVERRFHATDLGEVVTDKLIGAFPRLMDVGYTREMETELDKIEDEHLDWIDMLDRFYKRFSENLERAHEELKHAKAEVQPSEHTCPDCGAPLVYRFGKNGRFLSCSTYPECKYACPIDRQGRPKMAEFVDVACPKTGRPMIRKTGRFGPFLATVLEEGESPEDVGMILNIDKKGHVTAPSPPPLETDLPCPTCEAPLNLRNGVRGPWLGCSRFPKCRGRGKWTELPEKMREELEARLEAHEQANPIPVITRLDGTPLTDAKGKPVKDAPTVNELVLDEDPRQSGQRRAG
ncbi:MAG: DNA topoisomerase [Phycisphaerales bacterium JB037]